MPHLLPELAAVKQVSALSYHAEDYNLLASSLSEVHESSSMAFPRGELFKAGFILLVCVCVSSSTLAHVNGCGIQQ